MLHFLVLVLIAGTATAADPASAGMNAERLARIPVRMKAFADQGKAAGIVTLVARHGHVALLSAVGYQDLETKTPMRADSIFQIASMTKPVTSVGILILADEGKLALTDSVEKHLPEFRGQMMKVCPKPSGPCSLRVPSRPITIRDLLTHTSGMPGGPPAGLKDLFATRDRTLAEAVAIESQQPLEFEPGTRWSYSNTGMAALGRIIEVVSGEPYEKFIAARILTPLGMKDTFYFPPPDRYPRIAAIYTDVDGKLQRATVDLYHKGAKYPAPEGGLYSTASDMARFYQMLLDHGSLDGVRILSPAAVKVMTTVQTGDLKTGFAPGMGYGLGVSITRPGDGELRLSSPGAFGHGGAYRTYSWADPKKDMVGIIMLQRTNGGGDLADEISSFMAMSAAAILQ
jgi:CubicO group peptidase (beta-lactamase class C family)